MIQANTILTYFTICVYLYFVLAEPEDRKPSSLKRPASIVSGPQKLKKIQQFDLAGMVKPVAPAQQMQMSVAAFKRILGAECR